VITKLSLIRNVSQFESVTSGSELPLSRLALAYAENGRGKTTLAAILRSLGSGDPTPILERQRITAEHPPHIRIDHSTGTAQFQNGNWDSIVGSVAVYDDAFVDENIYSGLSVDSAHRHNLHELIVGSVGVQLNQQLRAEVEKIEEHNKILRELSGPISSEKRGAFSVEEFCRLPPHLRIDEAIKEAQQSLSAAKQQAKISQTPLLQGIRLASFSVASLQSILKKSLPDLEQEAAANVQKHLRSLGADGENWVGDGLQKVKATDCPFCMQNLSESKIIDHYRLYFSEGYKKLKQEVEDFTNTLKRQHGGEARAAFERNVRVLGENLQFWATFIDAPAISFDSIEVSRLWRAAFEMLIPIFEAKNTKPLEAMTLSMEAESALSAFAEMQNAISAFNHSVVSANRAIEVIKERANSGNLKALEADVAKLLATRTRYNPDMDKACQEYQAELAAKVQTEKRRDAIRESLNHHQKSIFPTFNSAINDYLRKFNAAFRLSNIAPENTRAGTACSYNVVIYDRPVVVGGNKAQPGQRAFKNTLSSGDRNTLALAFFFSMLDQDPNLKDKVVVIDDPMTSLDEHRTLTTVQEVRGLSQRVKQVIVLSHNKPFLCKIWSHAVPTHRTAIQVVREGSGSSLQEWKISEDSITEYDRKHQLLRNYYANSGDSREAAEAIRPVLEGYLRVACPEFFPPTTLLGPFKGMCERQVGTQNEILHQADVDELRNLTEYANKFHHDTNPAWETEAINDGELSGFVKRTLDFIRRG